ncbi:MAG: CapA family protein [Oleiphilaceae bacterium]|nr:CapA family protein [Oleiphilaceae bacterium]
MTGRGIDQILPEAGGPRLFEPYVKDARNYIALAERRNGPIDRPVRPDYIWGDALQELNQRQPDLRFINLETSITTSDSPWPDKSIHYRMHPGNIDCLMAAHPHGCSVANNHVLDWDYPGLRDTLSFLNKAGIKPVGAGERLPQAARPAIFDLGRKRRVIVCACAVQTSGVPESWGATADREGVFRLPDLSDASVDRIADIIMPLKRAGDLAVLSIHWGSNWGYHLETGQDMFAHRVIDRAGVDLVHGHSSHHPRGMEVYREKLILYGCGDFINDYEGIGGHEDYRGDLVLMYFPRLCHETGKLQSLDMVPLQMHRFQLRHPVWQDREWLASTLAKINRTLGTTCDLEPEGFLKLAW